MRPNPLIGDPTKSRVVIATYPEYLQAQRAVDFLSDQKFPVERTAIVGERSENRGAGHGPPRLDAGAEPRHGPGRGDGRLYRRWSSLSWVSAARGADFLPLLLDGLLIGVMIGAAWGLLSYALSGGRRDFTSVGGMRADHYSVLCDGEVAEHAQSLLSELPSQELGSGNRSTRFFPL